jgi:hypothetical protein
MHPGWRYGSKQGLRRDVRRIIGNLTGRGQSRHYNFRMQVVEHAFIAHNGIAAAAPAALLLREPLRARATVRCRAVSSLSGC